MDAIQNTLSRLRLNDRQTVINILALPISYYILKKSLEFTDVPKPPILRAPSTTAPAQNCPYPPDALPGGRDIPTPHGRIRAYEWGPETGRKVLFIHGISTPCIAFASLASKLVDEQGCRVLLFDLFGRGYSDTPDPREAKQDMRLWASQVMYVLSSSPLSWTGESGGGVTVVGYSLGGGIAANFTAWFPQLVESLVLIAPAGLLRPERVSGSSRLIYGEWLPPRAVEWLVSRRLRGAPTASAVQKGGGNPEATSIKKAAEAEVPAHPALMPDSRADLFANRPGVSVAEAVGWQVEAHPGFVPAFVSSIRYAPISGQSEQWTIIGDRLTKQREGRLAAEGEGLKEGRVLVLLGKQDGVILPEETAADATEALGENNVKVKPLEGGHDLPIVNAGACVEAIVDFWNSAAQ